MIETSMTPAILVALILFVWRDMSGRIRDLSNRMADGSRKQLFLDGYLIENMS